MIKEITKITRDNKCVYATMENNGVILTPKLTSIEPDIFVEDDFSAEYTLIKDIIKACEETGNVEISEFKKKSIPEELEKFEYYDVIVKMTHEVAKMIIYKNTRRFFPNYIICDSSWLPTIAFNSDFKLNKDKGPITGTYLTGTYQDMPVFVSPVLSYGEILFGVNNDSTPGIITFINEENKVCNKIASPGHFALIKLED